MNWEHLGSRLIERDWRPTAVLDRAGRIVRTNEALRFFFPDQRTLTGRQWLAEGSREAFDEALRALGGARARVAVSFAASRIPIYAVLELERLSERDGAVLVTVVEGLTHPPGLPLLPVNSVVYEVEVRDNGLRRVLRHAGRAQPSAAAGQPCWVQIFGRSSECPDCPVKRLDTAHRATSVMLGPGRDSGLTVVSAERRAKNLVGVSAFDVDAQTFSALMARRIDHLARSADLNARERDLLDSFLHGCTVEEAAGKTGISARAVKYHQQNLLRKLGVRTRQALCRLVR